jgi:hypothetical protein
MPRITTAQFACTTGLLTGAFGLWMTGGIVGEAFAPAILILSALIVTPREERGRFLNRPFRLTGFVLTILVAAMCIAVLYLFSWLVSERWGADWGTGALRVMRHPAIVIPLWAAAVFLVHRRWRITKPEAQKESATSST